MIEKAVALNILEGIEKNLKGGNTDKAIESIDIILNNKLYNLMTEYKKVLEKYRLQWQQEVFKLQDMAVKYENRPIRKLKLKPKHQNNNE